jgi:hypothetical protein
MKWVCLLAFGGVGLGALAAGLIWGSKRYQLHRNGVPVKGTVVELTETHSTERDDSGRTRDTTSIYPLVEFTPADGRPRRFRGSTGSSSPDYAVGQSVDVLYHREDPDNAQLADFSQFWLGPVAIMVFGLFFLAGGVGGFFLIADSDRTFGPQFHAKMNRGRLYEMKQGVKLKGVVREVEHEDGEWTLLVEASAPGAAPSVFLAPVAFDPGRVQGKPVEVYVDPQDKDAYYVHVDPLFAAEEKP